jgi:WD40 repeat protein
VNQEILEFKKLGRERRIFPIIVDGGNASHRSALQSSDFFPEALRFKLGTDGTLSRERVEPLAADVREHADGERNALLKLVASILDVDFDRLRRRDQQRRQRRLMLSATVCLILAVAMGILTVDAWRARREAERQRTFAEEKAGEARHQLGLAMVEKAVRLNQDHRQLSAALLSARALGLDPNSGPYLYPDVPARDTATSMFAEARVLRPTWRSQYRLRFDYSPEVRFDWEGGLFIRSGNRVLRREVRTDKHLPSPWSVAPTNVAAMDLSLDGRLLAMRFHDGSLIAWNLQSGQAVAIPSVNVGPLPTALHTLAVSPNGRYLAAHAKHQIVLVDVRSQSSTSLPDVPEDIFDLMFSPDDRYLISRDERQVRCWDLVESRWLWSRPPGRKAYDSLWPLAFSPSGELIGSRGTALIRVLPESGKTVGEVQLGVDAHRIAFSPDGREVLTTHSGVVLSRFSWPAGALLQRRSIDGNTTMSITISRDNQLAAVATELDVYVVTVSDLVPLNRPREFSGPSGSVTWAPDGSRFAAADRHGIAVWKRQGGEPMRWIETRNRVYNIAFSPDGAWLAGCGNDGVSISSTSTWQSVYDDDDDWDCYGLAFSPDRALLAASRMSGIDIIDLSTLTRIRTINRTYREYEGVEIHPIGFLPDSKSVVGGDFRGRLEVIDVRTGRVVRRFPQAGDSIDAVTVLPGGRYVAVGGGTLGRDGGISVYGLSTGERLLRLSGVPASVRALAAHPSQWILASAHGDGTVAIWDLQARAPLSIVEGEVLAAGDVTFDPTGNVLLTAGPWIMMWDASELFPAYVVATQGPGAATAIDSRAALGEVMRRKQSGYGFDYVGSGKILAVGRADGAIALHSRDDGVQSDLLRGHQGATFTIAADTEGNRIASAGMDGKVHLWNVDNRELLATFEMGGFISALSFSEDGRFLAAGGERVNVWNLIGGPHSKLGTKVWVNALHIHGDTLILGGTTSATGETGAIELWNIKQGTQTATLGLHRASVTAIDLQSDLAATGDANGTIVVWNIRERKALTTIDTRAGGVVDILWLSPDELATADESGALSVWSVSKQSLRSRLPIGRIDLLRRDPLTQLLATETMGLIRGWHVPTRLPIEDLLEEGTFEGLEWRPMLIPGLYGKPARSFSTPAATGGSRSHSLR